MSKKVKTRLDEILFNSLKINHAKFLFLKLYCNTLIVIKYSFESSILKYKINNN